jgi:hypothetical protein
MPSPGISVAGILLLVAFMSAFLCPPGVIDRSRGKCCIATWSWATPARDRFAEGQILDLFMLKTDAAVTKILLNG